MTGRILLALAITAAALVVPVAAQTFTFERSLPIAATVTTLDVTTDNGPVKVTAGDGGAIVGTIKLRRGGFVLPIDAADRARDLTAKPPISGDATTVFLRQPSEKVTREAVYISYDVRVPARMSVRIATTSGAIDVSGVAGGATVVTQSGDVVVTGLRGESSITTQSSRVSLQGSPVAAWRVTTGSGAIAIKAAADASFDIDATSETSDVKTSGLGVTGTVKGRLEAPIGKGGPVVTLRSHSGQIRIER